MNPSPSEQPIPLQAQLGASLLGPILALETSGKSASVAIEWPDGQIASLETAPSVSSAKSLAPAIAQLLQTHSVSPEQLTAIAVTNGPGSFTGLRVGVATAKSMAYALGIPTIAIDTLESMAWRTAQTLAAEEVGLQISPIDRVWTVLDAYRGQLFAALWQIETAETEIRCRAVAPSHLVEATDWTDAILRENPSPAVARFGEVKDSAKPWLHLVGAGLARCQRLLDSPPESGLAIRIDLNPHASVVAKIARRRLILNETLDAFQLMPKYLRGSAAEEKLGLKP
jgi:tRNA threonylcarbamoyl adenosine modification protein YeaZ